MAGTTLSWAATTPSCLEDAMKMESPITLNQMIEARWNDELCSRVKEVEAKIKEQQKESQAMEKKFELQEKRYKN